MPQPAPLVQVCLRRCRPLLAAPACRFKAASLPIYLSFALRAARCGWQAPVFSFLAGLAAATSMIPFQNFGLVAMASEGRNQEFGFVKLCLARAHSQI